MTGPVIVEADGGSRGNPGPAGYGALVRDSTTGEVLAERAASLGIVTNNVAEYSGLVAGLEAALELGARDVEVRMDSKLVVEQMAGRWKIKNADLRTLAQRAFELARGFDTIVYTWIPRERNAAADALANSAMDGIPVRRNSVATESPAPVVSSGWTTSDVPPTTMVLARHGSSVLSPSRRFSGRGDVPLSPDGIEQAKRLATRLAASPLAGDVTAVVSSPLRRARRTADAVASALGLDVVVEEDLVETDFGAWEGMSIAEVGERWPAELDAWRSSVDVAPPGGESFAATAVRVLRARDRLVTRYRSASIIVVTHVTPIKTLLCAALDAPASAMFRLRIDITSVSLIDWFPEAPPTVRLVNDTHHLL